MPFDAVSYAMGAKGTGGGSDGGVFVVNITAGETSEQLDKTWQEIYDAADSGALVLLRKKNNGEIFYNSWVTNIAGESSWYAVYAHSFLGGSEIEYGTTTANGYPTYSY